MNFQIEAQIREVDGDDAVATTRSIAAILSALVDEDQNRFYVALIPRPTEKEEATA